MEFQGTVGMLELLESWEFLILSLPPPQCYYKECEILQLHCMVVNQKEQKYQGKLTVQTNLGCQLIATPTVVRLTL